MTAQEEKQTSFFAKRKPLHEVGLYPPAYEQVGEDGRLVFAVRHCYTGF